MNEKGKLPAFKTFKEKYPKVTQWLASQSKQDGYRQLIGYLDEQISGCTVSALSKGDTDYYKGQVQALVRVRTILLDIDENE
jgi:hypothetical protein